MGSIIKTSRALTAFIGNRFVRKASILAIILLVLFTTAILVLSQHVSVWWWIMMVPIGLIAGALSIFYLIIQSILRGIYPEKFTDEQKAGLKSMNDQIVRLAEARAVPPFIYIIKTLWDLVRRKDATTIRGLIDDSTNLKSEFNKLSKLFD